MEVDLKTLLKELAVILLLAALAMGLYTLSARGRDVSPTPTPATSPTPVVLSLHDQSDAWDAALTDADGLASITDDDAFRQRFPQGLDLTLVDAPRAPEALRGDYDADPFALRFGAVWPEPQPGHSIRPQMEAWADCVRDFELGPSSSLRCYLFARGEPGHTLDRLAAGTLAQAVGYALTGRVSPDAPWNSADLLLSLSPSSP